MKKVTEFSERLKAYRTSHGLSFADLEALTGIPAQTLNRYELGQRVPKIDMAYDIAQKLGVNLLWLQGFETSEKDVNVNNVIDMTPLSEIPRLPVVGRIAAGEPILAIENIIGYEYVPDLPNPEGCFCLSVRGDSMINAGIKDGARVVIRMQPTAENGQVVACIVNGDEATLKRFKQVNDTIILMPENPKYEPIVLKASDFECGYARIIGVAELVITTARL